MYYRRKVLLALLDSFGGQMSKTDLQKQLFLFSQIQKKPVYDFMPYRFGCYSAQATQDLKIMEKYGLVEENDSGWKIKNYGSNTYALNIQDNNTLQSFKLKYKGLNGNSLIHHVYTKYPFYAIKSEIVNKILNQDEMDIVNALKPNRTDSQIFTIGYEGKSVEKYVIQLIKEDIKVLCDVRKNPLSMKFGFSKKQLCGILESIGIQYIHVPGLGIESNQRQTLNTKSDYDRLFAIYENTVLKDNQADIELLIKLYNEQKRIALTCFEADPNYCHRSRVSKKLSENLGGVEIFHL